MKDEEIKKIAEEYGEYESKTPKYKYPAYGNPARQQKECAKELAIKARLIFTWLSKDYCIVSKEKIRAIYNRNTIPSMEDVRNKMIEECLIDALFGKELFNGKEENNA